MAASARAREALPSRRSLRAVVIERQLPKCFRRLQRPCPMLCRRPQRPTAACTRRAVLAGEDDAAATSCVRRAERQSTACRRRAPGLAFPEISDSWERNSKKNGALPAVSEVRMPVYICILNSGQGAAAGRGRQGVAVSAFRLGWPAASVRAPRASAGRLERAQRGKARLPAFREKPGENRLRRSAKRGRRGPLSKAVKSSALCVCARSMFIAELTCRQSFRISRIASEG